MKLNVSSNSAETKTFNVTLDENTRLQDLKITQITTYLK